MQKKLGEYTEILRKVSLKTLAEPETVFPLAYFIFLASAFLSYKLPSTQKFLLDSFSKSPSPGAYLASASGILILVFFVKLGRKKIEIKRSEILLPLISFLGFSSVYLTLSIGILISLFAGLSYAALLFFISRKGEIKHILLISYAIALISALFSLYSGAGAIRPELRGEIAVSAYRAIFHGFAVFSAVLLIGFFERKKAFLGIALLASLGMLGGFKSDAIAVIGSAVFAAILLRKISLKEILGAFFSVLLILTLASTYIAEKSYLAWKIPPLLYPVYRFGFTFSVFSKIYEMSMPFGYLHGGAILDTTQRIISTAVLNYTSPHIITSSLFGPLTLDFGLIGILITSAFIGIYLGIMSTKKEKLQLCMYSMGLMHSLILIEVGLQQASMLFLLSILYLSLNLKYEKQE